MNRNTFFVATLMLSATISTVAAASTTGYVTTWYVGSSCEQFQVNGQWVSLPAETAATWKAMHDAVQYAATYHVQPTFNWQIGGCGGAPVLTSITIPTGN